MRLRLVLIVLTFAFIIAACSDDPTTGLDPAGEGGAEVALNSVPIRTPDGKTVAFGLSRSGSAGATAGLCGTRLQCFKTAITEANANTAPSVENVALVLLDGNAEQDVNMKVSGKQLLIAPDADPNFNGKPDVIDALSKVSLGGSTCLTCAIKAARTSFLGALAEAPKVIVLVSERPNGFLPADGTELVDVQLDGYTVIHAFAVGPALTCDSDPYGYGSLAEAAALTPGGSCTNVASFDGLGALLTQAIDQVGAPPPPDATAPIVTLTTPAEGSSASTLPTFSGAAGSTRGDASHVTVKVWRGSDVSVDPLQTLTAIVSSGKYSVRASQALTEGAYLVQAEQRDAAGNVGQTDFVNFTVVPPPPPPDGPVGKTVAWALSRSGSAGVVAGACGTRLQCFKTAIIEASGTTRSVVENAALVLINVADPEQDVNLSLPGDQLLIAPDADPNRNGKPDFVDAVNRVSLGGGTCFTCALQAAEWAFESASPGSLKVIVLISERVNTFRSTGYTSTGVPTGYPPMDLSQMTFSDPNTVVHAFAVGPAVRCDSDPNGYGSLNDAAALTPGGTCTNVDSFDGLSAVIATPLTR
ncbi:MAG: Ig-like domain-containing protein [Gemmatimonadota bacterium]|nr:Ig-like domain-containing protein [Gemmatimonadota bacterium]